MNSALILCDTQIKFQNLKQDNIYLYKTVKLFDTSRFLPLRSSEKNKGNIIDETNTR